MTPGFGNNQRRKKVGLLISNIRSQVFTIFFLVIYTTDGYGQEQPKDLASHNKQPPIDKRHFLSINPVKPFIGLPNLHYEHQVRKGIGITAFSEVMVYKIVSDFDHPDMVNTFGVSFYPFLDEKVINQGLFVIINTSYISYFRDRTKVNSFANGLQVGYKWLFVNNIFMEPKILTNYLYQNKTVLPGIEVLVGLRF